MIDYFQPEFYRFNSDSIILVEKVLSKIKSSKRILDIGAGCGILGIEIAKNIVFDHLVLLEPQEEFIPYLQKNIDLFVYDKSVEIVQSTLGQFQAKGFDLIICNPPYYLPGHGLPSKDPRRNIARTFVLDDWEVLINKIPKLLTAEGRAFVLVPCLKMVINLLDASIKRLSIDVTITREENFNIYELKL